MIHYFVGDLGHFFVILAFITSLVSFFAYLKTSLSSELSKKKQWNINGRVAFYVHTVAVIGIAIALFVIIANHYFEYHYAYNYSDKKLPTEYLISTFWNGQEGSFLLWMFWQAILGIILISTNRFWEAPVMTVFAIVQAFLASMILGVVIPGLALKIGSSPFILLRDTMPDAPVFTMQPDFIPKDGNGLNPLLQNYWMVIHPPTLFLGFAATLIPFSFCIAGLWLKKYHDWIRPALPWAIFASAILGLGILMGGYWAYETLNFGGYWNWDPVENGVYVPWLVLVASVHTMITYKNSETALKTSIILVIAVFILILYSTFLTRSGILGESSVHSFTDLGLSGQLLLYLFFFLFVAAAFAIVRWRDIPTSDRELSIYSREFWIFIGVLVLCMMGLQVIAETSKPVYNAISKLFGGAGNRAPRADSILFYSNFQLWFAVAIGILSAVGQFFWWRKMDKALLKNELLPPLLATLVLWALLITVGKVYTVKYIVLSFAGIFTAIANAKILFSLIKKNPGLSGGAVAHIGVGLMLIGIMASSGYSKVVSLNNTGMLISKEFSDEFNRDNLLLFVNEPRTMAGYEIEYRGECVEPRNKSGYVNKSDIMLTNDPFKVVAKRDISFNGRKLYNAGEEFEIFPENTYYKIEFRQNGKVEFVQYPRIQVNERMGGFVASPDISRAVTKDLYTHVSAPMAAEARNEWDHTEEVNVHLGQEFYANDYVSELESIERINEVPGVTLNDQDVAVKARVKINGEKEAYYAEPIFLIKDKMVGRISDEINELGLKVALMSIHPESNEFTLSISTRQKDWVVLKAVEKPLINVLWIGTLILMTGFTLALVRRAREFVKMREKGME
ncbi:MAG TPA: cytochrome c biogenesis protein CcsA [Cyclobacteriaceae bacterium]|nr:cytochrome c biogenesis protein CcsA [Cyclobacteriaceae bacterium]